MFEEFVINDIAFVVVGSITKGYHVIPVRVLEKLTKETLKGKEISYSAVFQASQGAEIIQLDASKHSVFKSLQAAKDYLSTTFQTTIDDIIKKAEALEHLLMQGDNSTRP